MVRPIGTVGSPEGHHQEAKTGSIGMAKGHIQKGWKEIIGKALSPHLIGFKGAILKSLKMHSCKGRRSNSGRAGEAKLERHNIGRAEAPLEEPVRYLSKV